MKPAPPVTRTCCLAFSICNFRSLSFEGPGDRFGQFLTVGRISNKPGFARVGEVAAFNQDGRALLPAKHAQKSRVAHPAVLKAVGLQQSAVDAESKLQVLLVKDVVGKALCQIIRKTACDRRRHASRCQAIGFQASLVFFGGGGIEVKAQEETSLVLVGEGNTV